MADPDMKRLDALCEEVARAWEDEADLAVVGRLSAQFPEHADELRDFAAYLLEETYGASVPSDVMERSEARTRALVSTTGRQILQGKLAEATAARPDGRRVIHGSIFDLLCAYIEDPPDVIVRRLEVTGRFLRGLGECAHIPASAARAFVARAVSTYAGLQEHTDEMLDVLLHPRGVPSLASARSTRPTERLCYADVVRRSGLAPAQVAFWSALDDAEAP